MPPKFGTSGLRGLVVELTDALIADYTRAFLAACPTGKAVYIGRDLRASSPVIAATVARTAVAAGVRVVECGALPTPALALAAQNAGAAAIMVTGSHIPADRNGLKFYTPAGEIAKEDEAAINARLGTGTGSAPGTVITPEQDGGAATAAYVARYVSAYGADALKGLRIGVYQHSSTARDLMVDLIRALGAMPVPLGRSDVFIPVDTEALAPDTQDMLRGWCETHHLDAVISTDGDADRPMLADATGAIVPGDILGVLSARCLGAKVLCTPISSNSMIADMPEFDAVHFTRIGSPHVIAAMEDALAATPSAKVVGYEANGGFLLGFTAQGPAGPLAPLMTRDCLLPLIAPLAAARTGAIPLADLITALPPRFTAADRIAGIPTTASHAFIAELSRDGAARAAFFEETGTEQAVDRTDGLRVTFAGGDVVHMRPSGNAPELRCYAEAQTADRARALGQTYLAKLAARLTP